MKEIKVTEKYDFVGQFKEGVAVVGKDNKIALINSNGELILPFKYYLRYPTDEKRMVKLPSSTEGLFSVISEDGRFGFIDKHGNIKIPFIYDDSYWFLDGITAVKKDGKYGFIDTTGKTVVPFKFDMAMNFHNEYAPVCNNEKWGLINKCGEIVVPCEYDLPFAINSGAAFVQKVGENYIIELAK